MSEVMDLMVKIGVTEEVTSAFHSISNLMEKLHAQSECEPIAALAANRVMSNLRIQHARGGQGRGPAQCIRTCCAMPAASSSPNDAVDTNQPEPAFTHSSADAARQPNAKPVEQTPSAPPNQRSKPLSAWSPRGH
jgi:hypothetical protein